ncbi:MULTISPECIES: hypothetical protein [unclassified Synechocystis]|uniref:hypothetical protein n=1 Tax=unclassified Synechocystis TaxID=2640012 RepID=UPI0003FFF37E|nr:MULTISPECIES: hypothetical protein [unclassified Synechocystis]AIE74269.1 hypothetical protein D082_17410 [Synechocystis sp. PCC 6714]MCT0254939.1 hypothetical protein [Synechocystis sp. CS-94]
MKLRGVYSLLAFTLLLGQAGQAMAEINWIVRPIVDPIDNTVSCVGIYQDYSHQLSKDQLILFIPGEFDSVELQLSYGEAKPPLLLSVGEKSTFGVVISGEIFTELLQAQQLTVKAHQGSTTVQEYSLNLEGMAEAVATLRTETCASGEMYKFPATYFLRYEDPPADTPPMGVPRSPVQPRQIQFPPPSRQGLPGTTGGGGTRAIDDGESPETPF